MRHDLKLCLAAVGLAAMAASAPVHAAPITPTYDTFGTLSGATFGGSGIPNDAVAISTISTGDGTLTFGLTAHGRYLNPAVGNNGMGTFFAMPGSNFGDPTNATMPSSTLGATWNFAYYIGVQGATSLGDFLAATSGAIRILYDFKPGAGTDQSQLGIIDLATAGGAGIYSVTTVQDSENLLFGFLTTGGTGITPPSGTFDPNASGEYTFALQYLDAAGAVVGQSAINVDVPEPATLAIVGFGLAGLGIMRRKRKA